MYKKKNYLLQGKIKSSKCDYIKLPGVRQPRKCPKIQGTDKLVQENCKLFLSFYNDRQLKNLIQSASLPANYLFVKPVMIPAAEND